MDHFTMPRLTARKKNPAARSAFASAYDSEWEDGWDTLPPEDRAKFRMAIDKGNQASDMLARFAAETGGSHLVGHRRCTRAFGELHALLDTKLSSGKSVSEELSATGHSLLNNHGTRVWKVPQAPLAKLCLTRTSTWSNLPMITEFLAGAGALRREHPLFPALVHDGARYLIDASVLWSEADSESRRWEFRVAYHLPKLTESGHYWLEYLGLFPLAIVAGRLGAKNILRLIGAWVLLEWCGNWRSQASRRTHDWPDESDAADEALAFLLRGFPMEIAVTTAWRPGHALREELEERIAGAIEPVIGRLAGKTHDPGGALDHRRYANLLIGCKGRADLYPREFVEGFLHMDASLALIAEHVGRALEASVHDTPQEFDAEMHAAAQRRPISPVDLLACDAVRNLGAMELIQEKHWKPYLLSSGFSEFYENERETPGAPMPHAGTLPLGLRLGAAAGSMLLARSLAGKTALPDSIFDAANFLEGPSGEANKTIHAAVKQNFTRLIAFHEFVGMAGDATTPDSWLSWVESHFLYAGGCGIDSVTSLIFPAFFWSDAKINDLLRHEESGFQDIWKTVRKIITCLPELYKKRNYSALRQSFQQIFRHISELNLRRTESLDAPGTGDTPPPLFAPAQADPFAAPDNVFSRAHLILADAAAPIEFERLGGGNPAALQHEINRLLPYIRMLRHIHSRPVIPMPRIRGRTDNGHDFDMDRVQSLMIGEDEHPFLSVDYRPAPRPDARFTVRILVDFSGSMSQSRVSLAKDFALTISLGLRNFDCILYFYSTKGSFYQLIEVYDSRRRKLGGLGALATICDQKYSSGWGWNPDAASLLALEKLVSNEPGLASRRNIIVHIGDMELCGSLKPGIAANPLAEVVHAYRRLIRAGHHIIVGRCGTDADIVPTEDAPHGYFHLPETGIDTAAVRRFYRLILQAVE